MSFEELDYYFFHCPVDSRFYTSMLPRWINYYYSKIDNYNLLKEFAIYFLIVLIIDVHIMITLKDLFDGGRVMKHKLSVYIIACLVVVLSIPSVKVYAAADYLVVPGYYTIESVDGVFTGTDNGLDVETISEYLYNVHNDDIDMAKINTLVSQFSEPQGVSEYNHYYLAYKVSNGQYYIYCFYIEGQDPMIAFDQGNIFFFTKSEHVSAYCIKMDTSNNISDWTEVPNEPVDRSYRWYQLPSGGTYNSISLFYSDCNLYYIGSAGALGYTGVNRLSAIYESLYEASGDTFYNYCPADLPYYDGEEIVFPEDNSGESNLNHLYFKSCDIGFCEPYGATNFSTFGGAYFYVKYQVDDWILEHINEYDIYFSATGYVGSRQYNGSKRVSLDQDGCITIPFSDIFTTDGGVVSNGFVSAVSSKVVDQRFYKTYLYSIAGEKLQSFIDKQNSVSGSFASAWDDLVHTVKETYFFVYNGGNGFSEVIQDVVQSQITSLSTVYKNYKINTFVYLVDANDNRSGNVGRMFDLYQGSDTSTDNQGLENDNPYVDDNDDYLPDVPDDTQIIETSTSGTGVNVYNMTPSQIKLVIDNGLEKFIAWYNSDPSTAEVSTGFWNSFGIFRNNPAADLYNEYFGFLPNTFKNIIFGCATIGIVGGVFCAVRRKLT